jgi:hypothetical protein
VILPDVGEVQLVKLLKKDAWQQNNLEENVDETLILEHNKVFVWR